jgi:hypothetical protein
MLFADKLSFDHPRKTADGYLVVRARAARAGIYDYLGKEIDPEGQTFAADQVVKVYRSEAEVFAQDSVASFLMKPVTNDHPSQPVTADNWRDHAKGVVGKALRDGDFLAFDIVLMDKAAILAVESGKRELSNGYASLIDFTPGETADGQQYDAVQKQIRGNHVAVVDKGRAGPLCRIGDGVSCIPLPGADLIAILTDERTYNGGSNANTNEPARRETSSSQSGSAARQDGEVKMPHTLIIDGLQVTEVSDQAKAAIEKLQGQVRSADEARAKAEADVAKLTTDKATADAKITTLEQQVKDAKLTPQQLRDAAKVYVKTIDTAKKLAPTLAIDADADEAAIRKAVVSAKLGDAAKDWSDEQIAVSFDTLAAQAPAANADPVRNALSGGVVNVGDAKAEFEASRAKQIAALRDAHKTPAKAD